jgi:catechol 2,3-dioxygenase-like lactoylglutathione lyase family enzyme
VAEAVRHGLSNRAIASGLGISADAVKYHVANLLSKLGFSSRREVRRWMGVAAASALRRAQLDPTGGTMSTASTRPAIGQIARDASDLDRDIRFYRDTIGLPLLMQFPGLAFFDLGGIRLMLRQAEATPQSLLYFYTDDIQARYRGLLDAGVEGVSAPHLIHRHDDGLEEWMAFFKDPDGRLLALMQQALP